jgi:hypothetical protein
MRPWADHHEVVSDDLDLVEQVGGEQDGAAAVGVVAQQVAHPADAGRVESVGGLVEDQRVRVADQDGGDPETLPYAEGVVADPPGRLLRCEADQVQHLFDALPGEPHEPLRDGQGLATRAPGGLSGCVEEDADLESGVGQVRVVASRDRGGSRCGGREADEDPHGGGLPGAVGSEEAGHATRSSGEADVVDGGEGTVGPAD